MLEKSVQERLPSYRPPSEKFGFDLISQEHEGLHSISNYNCLDDQFTIHNNDFAELKTAAGTPVLEGTTAASS